MHSSVFSELSIIITLGAAVTLLMRAFRQPLIVGYIITGVIAGPALLNIIHSDAAFAALSSMGVALLLFIIGLDLSVKQFARLGKVVFITTVVQIVTITGVGFIAARGLGFAKTESVILGLALALSSTIIIIKLLSDKKETTRLYAQIVIGILLLQDIVATGAKIGLTARSGGNIAFDTLALLVARGIGLVLLLYVCSKYVIPKLTHTLESSKELLLLFALGWGLGFATLFERAGFSLEIGALFAGVSLASLPYSSEMASRLKPLRDFFLIIFFITLGQTIAPGKLWDVAFAATVLSLVVVIAKPLVIMATMGLMGYTKRASFKAAITNSQVSEFSLVFLVSAVAAGVVSERASTTLTLVALLTFVISTYLIKYDNSLYANLERYLRFFERKETRYDQHNAAHHYPIVLFGYRRGGPEFIKTFTKMEHRFAVVDYDPEVVESLERQQINYIYGDATDPELLEEVDLDNARLVVSTISDYKTNEFLAHWLSTHNPNAVFVCNADSSSRAAALYDEGTAYVMMPHYIGSEKINTFLRKNGFNKSEFKQYREKHLSQLLSQDPEPVSADL